MKSWLGQHNSNESIVLYSSPLRVAIWFYLRMWYLRSSTQLIFTIVRSLSQITDQTRIPLPSHHLKYGKGWSRGCEFRGETWYNKVRYMRKFPFGSSICSRITICMRWAKFDGASSSPEGPDDVNAEIWYYSSFFFKREISNVHRAKLTR